MAAAVVVTESKGCAIGGTRVVVRVVRRSPLALTKVRGNQRVFVFDRRESEPLPSGGLVHVGPTHGDAV